MEWIDQSYLIYKRIKKDKEQTLVVGEFACGFARDAWTHELRNLGDPGLAVGDVIPSMRKHANDPFMLGFLVEQGVIATILDTGLPMQGCRGRGFIQRIFATNFPVYGLSRDSPENKLCSRFLFVPHECLPMLDCLVLTIQRQPGMKTVDGRFVHVPGKLTLRPIQIANARYPKASESYFFQNLPQWTRGLLDYEVDVEFIWITLDSPTITERPEHIKRTLHREVTLGPQHNSKKIHLSEVSPRLWKGLTDALSRHKRMLEQEPAQEVLETTAKKRRKM